MSRDKQIEEMAKVMHDGCAIVKATNQCRGKDCLDCGAVTLYEKGYRKADDVAREIFEEIEKKVLFSTNTGVIALLAYNELKKKYIGEDTNVLTNTEDGE